MEHTIHRIGQDKADALADKFIQEYGKKPNDSYWQPSCSYYDIVELAGEVLVDLKDGDYSGDAYFYLRTTEGLLGVAIIGYGSCSGCDALQACEDNKTLRSLARDILNSIFFFNTKEELLAWLKDESVQCLKYYSYCDGHGKFIALIEATMSKPDERAIKIELNMMQLRELRAKITALLDEYDASIDVYCPCFYDEPVCELSIGPQSIRLCGEEN